MPSQFKNKCTVSAVRRGTMRILVIEDAKPTDKDAEQIVQNIRLTYEQAEELRRQLA